MDYQESILGRDIFQENDIRVTPSGDLETVAGLDAYLQRIDRMLVTNPGEIFHRPEFGIGIYRFLNQPNTSDNVAKLYNAIRSNISNDSQTERVDAINIERSEDQVIVNIQVIAKGGVPVGAEFGFRK